MDNRSAEFWIKHLNLMEHPDHKDGYFAVPFEDPLKVSSRNKDDRPASSIAYFLEKVAPPVTMKTIFFKCQSTEMLFHHAGGPMTVRIVDEGAARVEDLRRVVLGPNVDQGHVLALPLPAGTWFTRLVEPTDSGSEEGFCVFSCVMAPGFHPDDVVTQTLETILSKSE